MAKYYDLNITGSEVQRRLDLANHNVLGFDGILEDPVVVSDELITSAESYQILYAPTGGRGEMLMKTGGAYYRNFRLQANGATLLDSTWYNEDGQVRKDRLFLNGAARDVYAYAAGSFGKVERDGIDGTDGTTPHIDPTTKRWFIGSVDTGIKAEGEDGSDGTTPHIDPTTGMWMIGETSTGVKAEGTDGEDGKSAYQIWLDEGHTGSVTDFIAWMKDTSSMIGPKYAATASECVMVNDTPTLYYVPVPNGSTFDVYLADEANENARLLAINCPGATQVANNFTTNSADVALSAKMGKQLKDAIDRIMSSLGMYAFPNDKPVMPWNEETIITEVEYLESNGSQLIDTGLPGDLNTEVFIKFEWISGSYAAVIGSRGDNTDTIQLYMGSNATQRFGNMSTTFTFSQNVQYSARINKTGLSVNGTDKALGAETAFNTPTNIFFFGNNLMTGSFRIYNVQITQNGTLVRNFVPVKVNNVGYMRDTVNDVLYSNAGGGLFTVGPEVV